MEAAQSKFKILPLTSVRFFAALYVLLYHREKDLAGLRWIPEVLKRIVGLGYVSVSFFFLLSGFILALVYLKDGRPVNRRRFYWARVARIYPLYLAAMLLDTPHFLHIQGMAEQRNWGHIAGVFLATGGLVQAWWVRLAGINDPGWSLSVEAFFYLLFPFVALPIWKMRGRLMWPFALAVYGGGLLLIQWMSHSGVSKQQQSGSPLEHFYIFILGICLAKLFVWIGSDEGRLRRLQQLAPWLLLVAAAGFLATPILNLPVSVMLLQHGIQMPLFALALLALASGDRVISSVFSAKWLVVLGEASFALYLIHVPIATIMRRLIDGHGTVGLLFYVCLCIGLSVVSLYWFENPARRWILQQVDVRRAETVITSSLAQ